MITAWLLVVTLGGQLIAVPGIATKAECDRLAVHVSSLVETWKCESYLAVAPSGVGGTNYLLAE